MLIAIILQRIVIYYCINSRKDHWVFIHLINRELIEILSSYYYIISKSIKNLIYRSFIGYSYVVIVIC